MKLEELIQKRFTEREELTKFLAKFGDYPAVFSPEAPRITRTGAQMFIIRESYTTMICRRMRNERAQGHCLYRCYARIQRMRQRKI